MNYTTTKRNVTIVAVFMAATLVVGTFATVAATQFAFAYSQKKPGHNGSKNGNTVTIQKDKQHGTQSGFDNLFEQEDPNVICTHPGENTNCIQEAFVPSSANLVVCKVVKNFNAERMLDPASAFTLQVTGNNPSPSSFSGSSPPTCTTITLGPGGYQVREAGTISSGGDAAFCNASGLGKDRLLDPTHFNNEYCVNFSQDCSGTIAAGETKTCTVTNSAADIG
jgi:hypothetical protein